MRYDEKVTRRQFTVDSLLCVGLDPEIGKLPAGIARTPAGVLQFLVSIIDVTNDLACAYKPNFAFFEAMGPEGMVVLREVVRRVPSDVPVIADAKRCDIGNTARLYASAIFDTFGFDAITVNPYQGRDSVEAYLAFPEKGVYVLARTSNPGAADFQDLQVEGGPLFMRVVRECLWWTGAGTIGFVVGATAPEQLQAIRREATTAPLLIPGIGAQGGDLDMCVRLGLTRGGTGMVFNASRAILYASDGSDYASAARQVAMDLRDRARAAAKGVRPL